MSGTPYRFVRLDAKSIGEYWPYFEYSLWESLPPGVTPSSLFTNNVLMACMAGDMQAWLCYWHQDEEYKLVGTVITSIDKDPVSGDRNLTIYSLKGYSGPNYPWKSSMEKLMAFAKSQGCKKLIAYTSHMNVMRIAETIGWKSNIAVLEQEVA